MGARRALVLLTNDDGIGSEGLAAMEDATPDSWEVYVVAPDRARNAASHALTLDAFIRVEQQGPRRYTTGGTPTDCVNIGVHRLLPRKPDLVLSGINLGGNLCEDVTYSGTVAAALEARLLHIPALAVSLAAREAFFFAPAARVACDLATQVLARGLPPGVLLNVNVPNLIDGARGRVRWTRLGRKHYGDCLLEEKDAEGRSGFRFGKDPLLFLEDPGEAPTDWEVVEQGDVSVTPLRLDMTDERFLEAARRRGGVEEASWTARS